MTTLAIDGGPKVRETPMPPWPNHEEDEVEAATEVLRSGRVNQWNGSHVFAFQDEYAAAFDAPHAVAVSNGTLALELGFKVHGIGPGDDVIVTPRSFYATASAIMEQGARPVFADVDRDSGCLTVETIDAARTPQTKAIAVVHIGGWPADMPAIMAYAKEHGLIVIEDAAQAHGATIDGRSVGSFGDAGCFSFCTDKIISTAGEGGMTLFRTEEAWKRGWAHKDHGRNFDSVYHKNHPPGFRWLCDYSGTNWRMPEVQAAIGRLQLAKLSEWSARRHRSGERLMDALDRYDFLRCPRPADNMRHAYYRVYVYVEPEKMAEGWDRDRFAAAVAAEGVTCMAGVCPEIYREAGLQSKGFGPAERLPVAKELGETSLMFLTHHTMGDADIDDMVAAIDKVAAHAGR